jgi:hypothetical protein
MLQKQLKVLELWAYCLSLQKKKVFLDNKNCILQFFDLKL